MSDIEQGLIHLLKNDPVFSVQGWSVADVEWQRDIEPGFPALVRIIIEQQLSTKVAETLWQRFNSAFDTMTPKHCLELSDEACRAFGFSAQKTAYMRGVSEAVLDGRLDVSAFDYLPDNEIHERLTALKGFGPWSAQMYLIFVLGRPDVWPAGDLGIQNGMQKYHKLDDRPDAKETALYGDPFKPHRTAAALLSWKLNNMPFRA